MSNSMAAAIRKTPKPQFSSVTNLIAKPVASSLSDPEVTRIKSMIRSESDPDRLTSLFLSSFTNPQFHSDRALYKLSIQKLARSERPDLIENILETQKSDPTLPRSEGFLIRIMTLYSEAGMVDHAVRTFEFIPKTGIKHSQRTLCALLTVFLKNKKYDMLFESFRRVPKEVNVALSVTAYNLAMQGKCETGDIESAQKLFDEMVEKRSVKPDVVSYTTLFNGYMRKGDKEGWEKVLIDMEESGLEDDVATYHCRIAGLCKNGRAVEAEELLDVMSRKKVRVNRNTYNMVIGGFCKEGNAKKAMKVYEKMKNAKKGDENGTSPNLATYVMLIKSLVENSEFDKALKIFNECVGRKWVPPFSAVRSLVEGLKKESRVHEAKDVVAKMNDIVKGGAMDAWKNVEAAISI